jgi:uncharacterized protein YyaL (SSP411 family)
VPQPEHRNRLADEPSLYLRQHGANPVDWYPWGEEALARAKAENKPILLSIGYSACHWCHVMERESFENPQTAELMNELYVCIKVDREERPDLDNLYMKTVQMMTGHGGWPMTVFLTPRLEPYYAGTYFPPEDRGQSPAFPRVLAGVSKAFHEQADKVAESTKRVVEALAAAGASSGSTEPPSQAGIAAAAEKLQGAMDAEFGGFGEAPKFPGTLSLSMLMGVQSLERSGPGANLVKVALDRMAAGGIHDHLGGGFHRYSVDRYWLVPHFEKMLYDQALLCDAYREAWSVYGAERYREVALGIADYVAGEMRDPSGAFYATQDADSEGVEGKYFVWTPRQIREVVGDDADLVCRYYGVTPGGNFEGASILNLSGLDREELARTSGLSPLEIEAAVSRARGLLLERRKQRVAPATDHKILTDWNGLMIGAMASAGRVFEREDLVECAAGAADFVIDTLFDGESLKHFCGEGEVRVDGFLDDYAFFGRACLDLYLASGRSRDYETACRLADLMIEGFEDRERGGFYFTREGRTDLLVRSRDLYDGAVPAGNSVATEFCLRLFALTGEERYGRAGRAALEAFGADALANPYAGAHLLATAWRDSLGWTLVGVAGESPAAYRLERAALTARAPQVSVIRLRDGSDESRLPPALRGKTAGEDDARAFVCRGNVCGPPVTDEAALRAALGLGTAVD